MWLVAFTSKNFTELYDSLERILTQEERERFLRKVIYLSKDVFILHEWEKDKLDELVRITREENAIKRGLERGMAEGIKKGIEQNSVKTVKNMLKENFDIGLIAKITGLTERKIIEIKESGSVELSCIT